MESSFFHGFSDELVKIAISPETISLAGRSRRIGTVARTLSNSWLGVNRDMGRALERGDQALASSLKGQLKEINRLQSKVMKRMSPEERKELARYTNRAIR